LAKNEIERLTWGMVRDGIMPDHSSVRTSVDAMAGGIWRNVVKPFVFAAIIMTPLRSAVADWNWVPTGSMKPTILEGDMVFVNKLAYDLKVPFTLTHLAEWSVPQHEDIAVFFSPQDNVRLVKRVVGCPGDTIELRNNVLFRNGLALESDLTSAEPFRGEIYEDAHPLLSKEHGDGQTHWTLSLPSRMAVRNFGPVVVPADQYFMMGDSRDNSHDSRFFGCVERKRIVGKAQGVLVSLDKNHRFLPRLNRFLSSLYTGV
jgi:signal peptidase I